MGTTDSRVLFLRKEIAFPWNDLACLLRGFFLHLSVNGTFGDIGI